MMHAFTGADGLAELGVAAALPPMQGIAALWLAWVMLPVAASGLLLERRKVAG